MYQAFWEDTDNAVSFFNYNTKQTNETLRRDLCRRHLNWVKWKFLNQRLKRGKEWNKMVSISHMQCFCEHICKHQRPTWLEVSAFISELCTCMQSHKETWKPLSKSTGDTKHDYAGSHPFSTNLRVGGNEQQRD